VYDVVDENRDTMRKDDTKNGLPGMILAILCVLWPFYVVILGARFKRKKCGGG
jgi:hypothetical protein